MSDDALRTSLRQLPAPDPSPDLGQRILRSRALGVRFTLPGRRWSVPWGRIASAAVVIALLGGSWMVSLSLTRIREWRFGRDRVREILREPLDELLRGMKAPPGRERMRRETPLPKYPLITSDGLNVTRLTGGIWRYTVMTTIDDVLTKQSGEIGIRLARTQYLGQAAWIINSGQRLSSQPWSANADTPLSQFADTTFLDPTSLRPLRSVAYNNRRRVRFLQTFDGDSGREAIDIVSTSPRSFRGSVILPFPREALFINDWSTTRLAVLLPAFPLAKRWRATLYQVAFISQTGVKSVAPVDLRVVGTDKVTVPAGTFDCWRVEVESHLWETEREIFWVSRDQGWLIKRQARGSDYVVNTLLQSHEPGN